MFLYILVYYNICYDFSFKFKLINEIILQYISSLNSREIGGTHGVSVVHVVVVQIRIVGIPVPHVRVPIVPIARRQGPHE